MMMDFDQRVILLSKLKLKKNECKPNNNTFVWFNVLSLWKWLKVVLGVDKIVTNSILFCTNNHIYIYILCRDFIGHVIFFELFEAIISSTLILNLIEEADLM